MTHKKSEMISVDENSYSVDEVGRTFEVKTCATCKHYYKDSFPKAEPCSGCVRCNRWEAHIEEVKFDVAPEANIPVDIDHERITATECIKPVENFIKNGVSVQLPDSGDRREFSTGSVRDVREGKGRYDLLSPIALKAYAKRMEDGMSKYGERNWEKGQPIMSYIDSGMRHLWNYIEDCMLGRVPEEDHLGASMWNIAAAIHTVEMIKKGSLPKSLDDTPKPLLTVTEKEKVNDKAHSRNNDDSIGSKDADGPDGNKYT